MTSSPGRKVIVTFVGRFKAVLRLLFIVVNGCIVTIFNSKIAAPLSPRGAAFHRNFTIVTGYHVTIYYYKKTALKSGKTHELRLQVRRAGLCVDKIYSKTSSQGCFL
jgi:hypothetical protein